MDDTCGTCRFFLQNAPKANGDGICRRSPPVPVLLGMTPPRFAGQPPQPTFFSPSPAVNAGQWCGEFASSIIDLSKINLTKLDG